MFKYSRRIDILLLDLAVIRNLIERQGNNRNVEIAFNCDKFDKFLKKYIYFSK